jgi:hypothetical protein
VHFPALYRISSPEVKLASLLPNKPARPPYCYYRQYETKDIMAMTHLPMAHACNKFYENLLTASNSKMEEVGIGSRKEEVRK